MKIKKWIKRLCILLAISTIVSTFTGCQMSANNGIGLTASSMDESLNIDLGMFSLYGRPLGDWTYKDLYGYICANLAEDLDHDINSIYNGVTEKGRYFVNTKDGSSAYIVESRSNITINKMGVSCGITDGGWGNSIWSISSYGGGSAGAISSICGQSVEAYLESICPGLYAKLQEKGSVSLTNGAAKMDTTESGGQRIILSVVGGNLELWYENDAITSLTVIFTEQWKKTTDVADAKVDSTFRAPALALNLEQYKLFGKPLISWKLEALADYIRNTYKLEYEAGGQESFFLGDESEEDRIWINRGTSIFIYFASGVYVTVTATKEQYSEMYYEVYCDIPQSTELQELGANELAALCGTTPKEYIDAINPDIYDTLVKEGKVIFDTGDDVMTQVYWFDDEHLTLQVGSTITTLFINTESGLIKGISVTM